MGLRSLSNLFFINYPFQSAHLPWYNNGNLWLRKNIGALLADLFKEFDWHFYEIPTAKLHTHRLRIPTLRFIHSYLENCRQKTRTRDIQLLGGNYV